MSSVTTAAVTGASTAQLGTVQGAAALSVLRKALGQQESTAAAMIASLAQPALATSGNLGTRVNAYA